MSRNTNETLMHNVNLLSQLTKLEVSMMPQTEAPLPSVEQVKQIISLIKSIIFPDYFTKRQCDETIRSYYIGVQMEELLKLLTKQIAHGLQLLQISLVFTHYSPPKTNGNCTQFTALLYQKQPDLSNILSWKLDNAFRLS